MATQLSERSGYGFAIGRVRSLEVHLLDRAAYVRFQRAADEKEFVAALKGTHYTTFLDADPSGVNVSVALNAIRTQNFCFFTQHSVDEWLAEIFRVPADAHNIKVILKHRLTNSEPKLAEILTYGRWSREDLQRFAGGDSDNGSRRTAVVGNTLHLIADASPATIDAEVDRWAQEEQMRYARTSDFLTGYFSLHADIENLRAVIRLKALGDEPAALRECLLPGGSITDSVLLQMLGDEWDLLAAPVTDPLLRTVVEEGVAQMRRHQSLLRLERLGRERELTFLRQSRYAVFGYEPLVAYYLQNENELRNLRQLYAACIAGVPEADRQDLIALVD